MLGYLKAKKSPRFLEAFERILNFPLNYSPKHQTHQF